MREEDFHGEERIKFYNDDDDYKKANRLRQKGGKVPKHLQGDVEAAYLPSPSEIQRRLGMTRQLYAWGFPERFIRSVMQKDNPRYSQVEEWMLSGRTAESIFEAWRLKMRKK